MTERASEFEWRREGEEAEIILVAPDASLAKPALDRAAPFAALPGVENPVYAAASSEGFGCVAASGSHVSATLPSAPERGVLLVVDAAEAARPSPQELTGLAMRALSHLRTSAPSEAFVRRLCEEGARVAAEEGWIREEDLAFLFPTAGDGDALGHRSLAAGIDGWRELAGTARGMIVAEVLDSDGADELAVRSGSLVLVVQSAAGELGRLARVAHRARIRQRAGEFGVQEKSAAAPLESGEARDLLAASGAAANFADGRMSTMVDAIRRAVVDVAAEPRIRASWRIGGSEERAGSVTHRMGLASVAEGRAIVSGSVLGCGTGTMALSVPPFGVEEQEARRHAWEEAGLLARWARMEASENGD